MPLYLVQHGWSLPKDVDPEKRLTEEGIREVQRIAGVAEDYGVTVAKIMHSGKKRARQTAEIFASALKPAGGVQQIAGINPLDDPVTIAAELHAEDNLMLVGHLPFMAKLVSFLVAGSVERPVFRFQNGGIVCLDAEPEQSGWIIRWTLMPHIA